MLHPIEAMVSQTGHALECPNWWTWGRFRMFWVISQEMKSDVGHVGAQAKMNSMKICSAADSPMIWPSPELEYISHQIREWRQQTHKLCGWNSLFLWTLPVAAVGKRLHNKGKPSIFGDKNQHEKSTISMTMFNSYVSWFGPFWRPATFREWTLAPL